MRTTLLLLALWLGNAPTRAHACSCVAARPARQLVPVDGATGFPIDGTLRVFLEAFPEAVRLTLGTEYRLRDGSGTLVPLDASVTGARLDLRPHARLSPSTTYTIEQVFAFDASGARATDLDRLNSTTPLRGVWYPIATFRTGLGIATVRAVAPSIAGASLHFAQGGGDCGPATSVSAPIALSPGVIATDVVELRTRTGTIVSASIVGLDSLYAGDMLCDPDPVTLPSGSTVDVRAVLIDAAGNELGASTWTRAFGHGARSASRTLTTAGCWPAISIIAAPTIAARGPAACPHGLEVVSRHEVISHDAPWAFGDRTTLATEGSARWIAYGSGAGPPSFFTLAGDGTGSRIPTSAIGITTAVCATSTGPIVTTTTYAGGQTHARLARFDARGATTWSVDLPSDGGDHRIVHGDASVLVAWSAERADHSNRLAWAMFDEATGAPTGGVGATSRGLDGNAEGPAVAFVDGRFLIVWPTGHGFRSGPLASAIVHGTTLGASYDLSAIDSYSPPDLVSAGARAGLVTADRYGHVLFSVLDRAGHLAAGPFETSRGVGGVDNRLPRIAWNGALYAIAWETYPTPGVYVAIADEAGAVSSAVRIDADERDAGTVAIAPTANGWLAGYSVDHAIGRTAELRCRSAAAMGPPQSIGASP